jgi:uncharacterized OB-fold protein
VPKDKSQDYKKIYDFPNVHGSIICTKCNRTSNLPANYCWKCGKELEEYQKRGLKQ